MHALRTRSTDDGYAPASIDRIEIITAVFDDNSYEGDTDAANRDG
jgi:hypothetical protein